MSTQTNGCPNCGCRDGRVVGRGTRWGRPFTKRVCRHCGKLYTVQMPDGVPTEADSVKVQEPLGGEEIIYRVPVVKCPECGSNDTPVRSTRRPIRHHKCRACGNTFKSVEK